MHYLSHRQLRRCVASTPHEHHQAVLSTAPSITVLPGSQFAPDRPTPVQPAPRLSGRLSGAGLDLGDELLHITIGVIVQVLGGQRLEALARLGAEQRVERLAVAGPFVEVVQEEAPPLACGRTEIDVGQTGSPGGRAAGRLIGRSGHRHVGVWVRVRHSAWVQGYIQLHTAV